jgi:hypothetical protein
LRGSSTAGSGGGSTRGDAEGTGAAAAESASAVAASATPRDIACSKVLAILQQLPQGAAMVEPIMTDAAMKLKNFTPEQIEQYYESLLSPEANGGITGSITPDSFKRLMVSLDDDQPGNPYDFSKDTFVYPNPKVF